MSFSSNVIWPWIGCDSPFCVLVIENKTYCEDSYHACAELRTLYLYFSHMF